MIVLSVYLHEYVVNTLKMYGELDDVVNNVLDESDAGNFDITDKPECQSRDGAGRYNITITNENYIKLLTAYGVKNKRISLRRLLYWFVDNEIYCDLGWECIRDYDYNTKKRINKLITNVICDISKLEILTNKSLSHIKDEILTYQRN